MRTKNFQTTAFVALTVALLVPLALMEQAHAEKITDSLTVPNAERDLKLAAGYKLYPSMGWVEPNKIEQIDPVYRMNHETGDMVLDLDAMLENTDENEITETSFDWIQHVINLFSLSLAEAG